MIQTVFFFAEIDSKCSITLIIYVMNSLKVQLESSIKLIKEDFNNRKEKEEIKYIF